MESPDTEILTKTINFQNMPMTLTLHSESLSIQLEPTDTSSKYYKSAVFQSEVESLTNEMFTDLNGLMDGLIETIEGAQNKVNVTFADNKLEYSAQVMMGNKTKTWKFAITFQEIQIDPLVALELKMSKLFKQIEEQHKVNHELKKELSIIKENSNKSSENLETSQIVDITDKKIDSKIQEVYQKLEDQLSHSSYLKHEVNELKKSKSMQENEILNTLEEFKRSISMKQSSSLDDETKAKYSEKFDTLTSENKMLKIKVNELESIVQNIERSSVKKIEALTEENYALKNKLSDLESSFKNFERLINSNMSSQVNNKSSQSSNESSQVIRVQGDDGHYYCGRKGLYSCKICDGTCGPNNGCNCPECLAIDIKKNIGPYIHCPRCQIVPLKKLENATLFYKQRNEFRSGNCRCDVCRKADRTLVMHCHKCEFDFCSECWTKVKR